MSDAAAEARTLLWEWVGETDDPDAEQRAWKQLYAGAMLDACATTGLLEPAELDRFRALLAGAPPPPPADADAGAALRHVAALRAAVPVLTRDPTPESLRPAWRHAGALDALAAAGVLTQEQARDLHARELAASAPWLPAGEVRALAGHDGVFALAVPASTPAEEAEDAEAEAQAERFALSGALERVLAVVEPVRVDGLAVVAAVVRSEVVELRFHHVVAVEDRELTGVRGFDALVESLDAPVLRDDLGTAYAPVAARPADAHGRGARAGGVGYRIVTGSWRYLPAAPAEAERLVASRGAAAWTLR